MPRFAASDRAPSAALLRDLFQYDAARGALIWNVRKGSSRGIAIRNARFAGKVAGSVTAEGYRYISVHHEGRHLRFLAHRAIWIYHHGPIEIGMQVDHINGDSSDHRIENLRLASHAQNCQNSRARSRSGLKGVRRFNKRFQARLSIGKKEIYLGMHATAEDAAAAYMDAAHHYFGEFARGA